MRFAVETRRTDRSASARRMMASWLSVKERRCASIAL
jgi:hypothetical protein